ncbi:CHASE2 domain-containing protein [Pseudomonadota bacterium]
MLRLIDKPLILGLLNGLLGALFFLTPVGTSVEEDFGLGWLFQVRGPNPPPTEVVLVTIDTASMRALELDRRHYKWPRALHADLVNRLSSADAAFLAFDVYFGDSREPEGDQAFADAMGRAGNVLLFQLVRKDAVPLGEGGGAVAFTERIMDPIPVLRESAAAMAPFMLPGVPVKVSQFWKFKPETGDTPTLPALAFQYYTLSAYDELQALLQELGIDNTFPKSSVSLLDAPGLAENMKLLRQAFIRQGVGERLHEVLSSRPDVSPLLRSLIALYSGNHSQYLNYYGPPNSIRSISYHKVLQMSEQELLQFRGKAVFVGASEAFQWDQVDTFYTVYSDRETGHNISGVEVGATAFGNLLQGIWIKPMGEGYVVVLLFVWGVVVGFSCRALSAGRALLVVGAAVFIYLLVVHLSFNRLQLWLPLITPLFLQVIPILFIGIFGGYGQMHRERANIAAALGRYLPAQVVTDAARSIHRVGGAGKTVYGACLATDAEQYTRLSERLTPKELRELLNEYYEVIFGVIHRRGGSVVDVVGDSVMALWFDPEPQLSHRVQALRAAQEITAAINEFNRGRGTLELPTRIGLHYGEIYIGDVGAGKHFEYRAIGDTVNTVSRIEGANKIFGTRLLVSGEAVSGIEGVTARELGEFRLVGKSRGVRLLEPLVADKNCVEDELPLSQEFGKGVGLFNQRKWDEAFSLFSKLSQTYPQDGPVRYYLQLCDSYRHRPPAEEWDGVIELGVK